MRFTDLREACKSFSEHSCKFIMRLRWETDMDTRSWINAVIHSDMGATLLRIESFLL